jgi:hypothetical protein
MLPPDIAAGAVAVSDIVVHFRRLKARGQELLDVFRASDRGFFTPSEDDEVRHLLVSYWQSRNAAWEVVKSFRQMDRHSGPLRPVLFLVAYAGALALIDVARFLRNHFRDRPVVRQKLNEPDPAFGIPEGTYDCIQKSLTSPLHAWHLYHALRYSSEHATELVARAREHAVLAPLWQIVQELEPQIAVGFRQYVRARAHVRVTEVGTILRRDLLGQALYGLQKAASEFLSEKYLARNHCPALPADVAAALRSLLRPGDVLITRKEHALTNYFLPGYWPHAALFLGGTADLERMGIIGHANVTPRWRQLLSCDSAEPLRVLEALKDGVRIRSLACPLTCDAIAVLRPLLDESLVAQGIARGFMHEGKAYDFDFDFTRSDRLVCTEVVYRSYEGLGGMTFSLTRRAGRLTLAAEDLLRMALERRHFQLIAAYSCSHTNALTTDEAADHLIRATIR